MKKRIRCPYCHSNAVLRPASYVYGKGSPGMLYVCARYPECDAYVGVHKATGEPLGILANGNLRNKRIKAHRVFDLIWKKRILSRPQAYHWLQDKFGLNKRQAHIALFGEYMCDEVIRECKKILLRRQSA